MCPSHFRPLCKFNVLRLCMQHSVKHTSARLAQVSWVSAVVRKMAATTKYVCILLYSNVLYRIPCTVLCYIVRVSKYLAIPLLDTIVFFLTSDIIRCLEIRFDRLAYQIKIEILLVWSYINV